MDNLHPQAELLLAYADQQLSDVDKIKAEKLLANDSEAVNFLEKLGVSDLPYAKSFEFMLKDNTDSSIVELAKPKSKKSWLIPTSIAASLLLGVVIGFFSFSSTNNDNWITQVADYHLLYGRETVGESLLSNNELIILKEKLSKAIERDLKIPNLSAEQLQFKRGQVLEQNGNPLIQLVYLPSKGKPIALCLLQTGLADTSIEEGKASGMPLYTWSKNGLSYMIIGDTDKQTLKAAAVDAAAQIEG